MKRIASTNHLPRSPFSLGLCILGALLIALSAWQGFGALRNPVRSSIGVQPVSHSAAKFERRAIESLRPGDRVLAFDPETGERNWKRIDHAFKRVTDHLRILTIRSEDDGIEQTIKTTDEHPFWVPGQEWKSAGDLIPGDPLVTTDGLAATVVATQREEHPDTLAVFNLNIRDFHTYYVAEDYQSVAVLVHNANAEDCAKLAKAGKEAAEALAKKTDDAAKAAKGPFRGGFHGKTTKPSGDGLESHHMPADAVNGIPKSKGPAIQMDPTDHAATSSNGKRPGSAVYRDEVERLIAEGRMRDAMAKEIRDVRRAAGEVSNNPRKYNEPMKEMLKYAKKEGIVPLR